MHRTARWSVSETRSVRHIHARSHHTIARVSEYAAGCEETHWILMRHHILYLTQPSQHLNGVDLLARGLLVAGAHHDRLNISL